MSGLWGPVEVALAKATETIPAPTALPGRTRYEMKWDGFRIAVVRTEDHTALWSRQGSRLDNQFPDLLAAAADQLPPGVVLDGEAVIWSGDRLDFSALLSRMSSSASSARRLANQQPASFVAFDVLAVAGRLKTASFLPQGNFTYPQMPYTQITQITQEEYEAASRNLQPAFLDAIYDGDMETIDAIGEAFCETDDCELDDLKVNADFDAATTA